MGTEPQSEYSHSKPPTQKVEGLVVTLKHSENCEFLVKKKPPEVLDLIIYPEKYSIIIYIRRWQTIGTRIADV